ncbi:MAG: carbohydrate binding domain-containing protein [Bacteroidaceae bacterium]|nr:carbohydrate binding domain-containing protein [Bacteroidaceae bacterium]
MTNRTKILIAGLAAFMATAQAQVTIDIDALQRGPNVSPMLYGIFYEDINHAADGGIYAELIRNRSFEDGPAYGAPADMQGWTTRTTNPSQITARLIQPDRKTPLLNTVQHNALELDIKASATQPASLVNEGFWGINAVQGRTYKLTFWARNLKYRGSVKAMLCSKDGSQTYAETVVNGFPVTKSKDWTKYEATLKADYNDPQAQFALVFDGTGQVQLDVISLFPPTFKNRENGMRPDLANMLWQLHPKFMRFPGGCFVEGQESPDNAFRWERTIGPIEEREGHWNVNWGYRTTDGLGYHEYLQLAEDLGAKPLYVVNVGIWHGGVTPYDSIQPWIDECLNALEYANGPVTSKYGAMRARNGHPEPFGIEYLEIGNENNQPDPRQQSDHYYERYEQFYNAIRAKYPDMKIIGNVVSWGDDNPKWNSTLPVDLLDEHYYRSPDWFAAAFHKYDTYDRRGPKVYVGEYAVTNGYGNLGNMNAALGEAVYMMGMENNSDVVELASYAPIFVNENDARWRPDMVRFSSSRVMGTPSYYVQQLMPQHIGTQVVKVSQTDPYKGKVFKPLTPGKSRVGYGTWNTQASFTHMDPLPKSGQPEYITGNWTVNTDGSVSQTGNGEQCIAMCKSVIDSDHYTVKCRARKDSGAEGFIIVFNYVDEHNYCWVNFGGWTNSQHAIEQISNGGKLLTASKRGRVQTGRWYDVTLQVAGDSVKAWLDQELIFDTVLKHDDTKGIFSSATINDATGELIVKVVNTGDEATTASLNLKNFTPAGARVVRLAANDGLEENTLDSPTAIHPVEQLLSPDDKRVLLDIPPYSLNIVRIAQ